MRANKYGRSIPDHVPTPTEQRQADAVAAYHKRLAHRAMWNRVCMYAFAIGGAGVVVSIFLLATN